MNIIERVKMWLLERQVPQSTESVDPITGEVDVFPVVEDRWELARAAGHPGKFWVDEIVSFSGLGSGPGVIFMVHPSDLCQGWACAIHNPTDHHMRDWPLKWHSLAHTMERICEHGNAHPDPDDFQFHFSQGHNPWLFHSCCGCCVPPGAA